MTRKRWTHLMQSDAKLHPVEIAQGWHFCWDWDGLLVGPGMQELEACICHPKPDHQTTGTDIK